MSAYMIANVRFTDPEKAQEYGRQVAATVALYGGHYLARGGAADAAEGAWQLHYVTIVEFPSLEQARRWYQLDAYAPLKRLRQEHAATDLVFVEGVPSG